MNYLEFRPAKQKITITRGNYLYGVIEYTPYAGSGDWSFVPNKGVRLTQYILGEIYNKMEELKK